MRYFPVQDYQYMVLAFFIGLICVILTYMAWGSYPRSREGKSAEEIAKQRGHEMATGHHAKENPVAPFLIYLYIFISIWSISYMVFVAVRGDMVGY